MILGINGNEANVAHRVGIGQYSFGLLSHLSKIKSPGVHFRVYLSSPPLPDLPKESNNWSYEVFGPPKLWMLTGLERQLIREKLNHSSPDVFFTSTHYSPLYMPMPSVLAIMDLAYEKFPQFFTKKDYLQLKYWTHASVMLASKIITISEYSKQDICSLYAVSPDKVVVTYPGFDAKRFHPNLKKQNPKTQAFIKKYHLEKGYFLYLGTLQPKKNVVRLVEAFSQLTNRDIKLVIVGMIKEGRGGWLYEPVFAKVKELGLEKRVIFTGYLPDEQIPSVYLGAKAYVLPSLYEGFGIPPLEAMATGIPVVVSKVSSLPEVCGQAPFYIENPYQISSIKATLEQVLVSQPQELANRVNLGLQWIKRYNWQQTADKTLEVLLAAVPKPYV